ncbi:MAG TPA: hypothetical protein VEI47_10050 [Gemmatimonadales bacterium]|nr:hypothetical protein [Gemmatimonadales bacterium]
MTWQWWCAGVIGVDTMAKFMQAMLGGMAILVLPSFVVCSGIALMVYRRWDRSAEGDSA